MIHWQYKRAKTLTHNKDNTTPTPSLPPQRGRVWVGGVTWIGVTVFLLVCAYSNIHGFQEAAANNSSNNSPGKNNFLQHGKLKQATPPANALFGMIYINTTDNREYIYDGAEWVPHDASVADYYNSKLLKSHAAMAAQGSAQYIGCLPGQPYPAGTPCEPTGAHGKHSAFECDVCHLFGGVLSFDPNGPAVPAGSIVNGSIVTNAPLPGFDINAKTCSNISCHGMYSGTFSYYFPGGDGEPELRTVSYAGSGGSTPAWYSSGAGCSACHGNPPRNGTWHSGYHAGVPTSASNQCQFCHPDASGSNGLGTTITNPALHANGTVEVQARFTSSCFGCH